MEMRPKKWKALLTLFCFGLIAMPGITAPAKDHTMRRARLHTPADSGRIPWREKKPGGQTQAPSVLTSGFPYTNRLPA